MRACADAEIREDKILYLQNTCRCGEVTVDQPTALPYDAADFILDKMDRDEFGAVLKSMLIDSGGLMGRDAE